MGKILKSEFILLHSRVLLFQLTYGAIDTYEIKIDLSPTMLATFNEGN